MSVHTWTTQCSLPEDGNIHSYHCENLKSYMCIFHTALLQILQATTLEYTVLVFHTHANNGLMKHIYNSVLTSKI
jgi:hypothetical protein